MTSPHSQVFLTKFLPCERFWGRFFGVCARSPRHFWARCRMAHQRCVPEGIVDWQSRSFLACGRFSDETSFYHLLRHSQVIFTKFLPRSRLWGSCFAVCAQTPWPVGAGPRDFLSNNLFDELYRAACFHVFEIFHLFCLENHFCVDSG